MADGVGAPERVTLVTGLRGTGKTVMLNAYEDVAKEAGWLVLSETAGSGVVDRLTDSEIPGLLRQVQPQQTRSRVTGVGAVGFSAKRDVVELNEPVPTLRSRLNQLLEAVGPDGGVLLSIDELHRNDEIELVGATVQHLMREGRNVAFVGAGLPGAVQDLLSDKRPTTFLRRADRRVLGVVSEELVAQALRVPFEQAGRRIEDRALAAAVSGTEGYPFMIQLVGSQTWRAAGGSEQVLLEHAVRGVEGSRRKIGQLVHEPALADLSDIDRSFLAAMAQDPAGPSRLRDVADRLGVSTSYAGQYRLRLIQAEMIHPVGHGLIDFSLPQMRAHLRQHAAVQMARLATPAAGRRDQPGRTSSRTLAVQHIPPGRGTPPTTEPSHER